MGYGTTSLTLDSNYYPSSWTPGKTISAIIYNAGASGNMFPSYVGLWTLQYDDAYYSGGAPGPTTVTLKTNSITTCTLQPGYPTISGTTVTLVYNVAFATSPPPGYAIQLTMNVTAPSDGLWHISNPWVFAPGNTIDRSNRYAVDDNVVRALSGPTGRGPGTLRFMDSLFDYGGETNYVDASDLINPNWFSWACPYETGSFPSVPPNSAGNPTPAGTVIFQYARYLNTNPSSATYTWSSTKIYSSQSWALSGTDSFGPYLDMTQGTAGVNDDGNAVVPPYGKRSQWLPVELRSTSPHNLKSYQCITFSIPTFTGTLTSGSPVVTGISPTTANLVTGIAVTSSSGYLPAGTTILSIDSATQITLSANATGSGSQTFSWPNAIPTTTLGNVPFEYEYSHLGHGRVYRGARTLDSKL